jgi:hypothetical protein
MTRTKNPAHRGDGGGAEQMAQLTRLYADDTPPAPDLHPYQPRRVGEIVEVAHLPGVRLEVVALDDPSLITLRTPNGATLRAGWRTVRRVQS